MATHENDAVASQPMNRVIHLLHSICGSRLHDDATLGRCGAGPSRSTASADAPRHLTASEQRFRHRGASRTNLADDRPRESRPARASRGRERRARRHQNKPSTVASVRYTRRLGDLRTGRSLGLANLRKAGTVPRSPIKRSTPQRGLGGRAGVITKAEHSIGGAGHGSNAQGTAHPFA